MQINLTNRNLDKIPKEANANKATQLLISQNQIEIVGPEIKNYPQITHLMSDQNLIKEFTKDIYSLANLQHISITNSGLKNIPKGLVGTFRNLRSLNFSNNGLTELDISKLPNSNQLFSSIFAHNKIRKATFPQRKNIHQLQLQFNRLKELDNSLVNIASTITHLHLNNNDLAVLPDFFDKFPKLVHLDLSNNELEGVPKSLKDIAPRLSYLNLVGNNIDLPSGSRQNSPTAWINKIPTHDRNKKNKLTLPKLATKEAAIFVDSDNAKVLKTFSEDLIAKLSEIEIGVNLIKHRDELDEISNIVFLILPIDQANDNSLFFDIAKYARDNNKDVVFLVIEPEKSQLPMDIRKGELFHKRCEKIRQDYSECTIHSDIITLDDLKDKIVTHLQQVLPKLRLKELTLKNFGHFENFKISFEEDYTCILGLNGIGKTTIFKAISAALLGRERLKEIEDDLVHCCRIQNVDQDGSAVFLTAEIFLCYDFNNKTETVKITIDPLDNGRTLKITDESSFDLFLDPFLLKTLVLNYPQGRKLIDKTIKKSSIKSKYNLPHRDDITTAFVGEKESRLGHFQSWLTSLAVESNVRGESNNKNSLLNIVFKIISEISSRNISFSHLEKVGDTFEVWVKTFESPEGVPLSFLSHGYQDILNWLGHTLQRYKEACGMKKNPFEQPSVVIIDEIDASIHPIWQGKMIAAIKKHLPEMQLIFSTHSPVCVYGLDSDKIRKINREEDGKFTIENLEGDLWALEFEKVLVKVFDLNTTDLLPENLTQIEYKMNELKTEGNDDSEEYAQLEALLRRWKKSTGIDQIEALKSDLRKQIDLYKEKVLELENNEETES